MDKWNPSGRYPVAVPWLSKPKQEAADKPAQEAVEREMTPAEIIRRMGAALHLVRPPPRRGSHAHTRTRALSLQLGQADPRSRFCRFRRR